MKFNRGLSGNEGAGLSLANQHPVSWCHETNRNSASAGPIQFHLRQQSHSTFSCVPTMPRRATKAAKAKDDEDLHTAVASLTTALDDLGKRLDTMDRRLKHVDTGHRSENTTQSGDLPGTTASRRRRQEDVPEDPTLKAAQDKARHRMQQLGLDLDGSQEYDTEEYDSDDGKQKQQRHCDRGVKSGKLRTAESRIKYDLAWPHFYVHRADNSAAQYDTLSVCEFVHGYLCLIAESPATQQAVLQAHLQELMEDSITYKWPVIRGYHAIILNMMETGRLTWSDTAKIQALRRIHVWQSGPRTLDTQRGRPRASDNIEAGSVTICQEYQRASCPQRASHDGNTHACAHCWSSIRRLFQHPEDDCRRKQRTAEAKKRATQRRIIASLHTSHATNSRSPAMDTCAVTAQPAPSAPAGTHLPAPPAPSAPAGTHLPAPPAPPTPSAPASTHPPAVQRAPSVPFSAPIHAVQCAPSVPSGAPTHGVHRAPACKLAPPHMQYSVPPACQLAPSRMQYSVPPACQLAPPRRQYSVPPSRQLAPPRMQYSPLPVLQHARQPDLNSVPQPEVLCMYNQSPTVCPDIALSYAAQIAPSINTTGYSVKTRL